jgi:hypothetical protein
VTDLRRSPSGSFEWADCPESGLTAAEGMRSIEEEYHPSRGGKVITPNEILES